MTKSSNNEHKIIRTGYHTFMTEFNSAITTHAVVFEINKTVVSRYGMGSLLPVIYTVEARVFGSKAHYKHPQKFTGTLGEYRYIALQSQPRKIQQISNMNNGDYYAYFNSAVVSPEANIREEMDSLRLLIDRDYNGSVESFYNHINKIAFSEEMQRIVEIEWDIRNSAEDIITAQAMFDIADTKEKYDEL